MATSPPRLPKRASSRSHWCVSAYDGSTGKQYTPRKPPCPKLSGLTPDRRIRGTFAADVKCTNIATTLHARRLVLQGPRRISVTSDGRDTEWVICSRTADEQRLCQSAQNRRLRSCAAALPATVRHDRWRASHT
jgi:hypothetical protein